MKCLVISSVSERESIWGKPHWKIRKGIHGALVCTLLAYRRDTGGGARSCARVCNPDPYCSSACLTEGWSQLLPPSEANNGTPYTEQQLPISSSPTGSSSRAGSPLHFSLEFSIPNLTSQQPAGTKNRVWDE